MAVAAVAANVKVSLATELPPKKKPYDDLLQGKQIVMPPAQAQAAFTDLMRWLKDNKWLAFLRGLTGVDLDVSQAAWPALLSQALPVVTAHGFDDFAGQQFIEPGCPEFSLLYHALASPRVTPEVDAYPSTEQLDALENYIFGSVKYVITESDLQENYVVAVFAYEYRPAYKTPDNSPYAGMVYSRTGIGRIGDKDWNYDAITRSYTNKPADHIDTKHIAVSPARYGVFLARKVPASAVHLYTSEGQDGYNCLTGRGRFFLQPIQKVFNGDELSGGGTLLYAESHRNEKLAKLSKFGGIGIPAGADLEKAPFLKISASDMHGQQLACHHTALVTLMPKGSSILVGSKPQPLIREARNVDQQLYGFTVPAGTANPNELHSNRRYTSLKLQSNADIGKDAWDYILTEGVYKKYKATRFGAPRNAPLFANIRHKIVNNEIVHVDAGSDKFEELVFNGDYKAALFEDNICDGCIAVQITPGSEISQQMKNLLDNPLPAFSLVSAPDFFPLSETYDLKRFDINGHSSFLEGGIENLSYCRLPVNPNTVNPLTKKGAFVDPPKLYPGGQFESPKAFVGTINNKLAFDVSDTLIAIVSGFLEPPRKNPKYKGKDEYKQPECRDYFSNNYMTDSAAFFFAPGWDATYSGKDEGGKKPVKFLATIGLGAPFPEDMKLCAAGNGMWPVASPDAARTFMGSLSPIRTGIFSRQITPTAVPLLDQEIGIHPSHPGLSEPQLLPSPSFGWDGEQGPCLERVGEKFYINFTDIGRADYVWNLRDGGPGFDMSSLRDLTCQELIARMDALRLCKTTIEGNHSEFSKYWLVSAEKVTDWSNPAAIGVPPNLVGNDKNWIRSAQRGITGSGYLYILADTIYDGKHEQPQWVDEHENRRRLSMRKLFVCKIAGANLAWCKLPPEGLRESACLKWKNVSA